jgi:hypothetical protein
VGVPSISSSTTVTVNPIVIKDLIVIQIVAKDFIVIPSEARNLSWLFAARQNQEFG